jgi:type II secretory pathway component GspD/PulD (secretin)
MQGLKPVIVGTLLAFLVAGPAGAQNRPAQVPGSQPAQPQGQPPQAPQGAQSPQGPQPAPQPMIVQAAQQPPDLPLVEFAPILQRVERSSNKRFLVDRNVPQRIYLAGVEANDVTYPILLSLLRANNLAAVEIEGRVNIVSVFEVRNYPVPMVQNDDASIAADEWVTRVLTTTNVEAEFLVPILRPMMPQWAHLAAMADNNKLILVDRYANVQRITELVRSLDVAPRD